MVRIRTGLVAESQPRAEPTAGVIEIAGSDQLEQLVVEQVVPSGDLGGAMDVSDLAADLAEQVEGPLVHVGEDRFEVSAGPPDHPVLMSQHATSCRSACVLKGGVCR